jgi:hypothetical protein
MMLIRSRRDVLAFVVWFMAVLLIFICLLQPAPTRAADLTPRQQLLEELLTTTQLLMQLNSRPQFVEMTTQQMKEDGCANPEKCPTLVSVHPPGNEHIIVNADVDLADLNAQGQIVHVIAMYLVERAGGYSPDMPCDRVMQIEAHAQVVQAAFMDIRLQEYIRTGRSVPPFVKHQVITFCTPPAVKGAF